MPVSFGELFYAGVGSPKTPNDVLDYMRRVAKRLAEVGFVLRSGAADGVGSAFESGCDMASGKKEIWLPWKGFNGHADTGFYPSKEHEDVAAGLHPIWEHLGRGPRRLHALNVGQVLGDDLARPALFVLCWTLDGCEHGDKRGRDTGGTGMAIAVASLYGVPVINLRNPGAKDRVAAMVRGVKVGAC